ncbi:1-acyl-sn-glycerol-3-phosphate acyltransferase [Streptomyces sp. H10-C2]|uniref:1-acyl-sn-glycerol-3-phosphate acyltransferase n=1 Tax=unclassified Streptomyces TaxID=2593676 RepID=UPI0024BAC255|nr:MULTISPECIES: 1-acyl-sn-glycerol-3-phosphate acyltransferase [unclassified Streptomyces]MDJ0341915.1 1-acyl-sn-glycerol-3-phosphate acyltransferase [Streptomyces sp. PH10-H1]MDJ0369889.1 1-acyl-sn-glycerol-3-phosphate acyltransferase [Streptomyces sp. H10-C2]MDJ0370110.1 1-acyl-sn-glycerol-3-phosphate acyltransferase [Streptomyces sp. H10-C2]
MADAKVIPFDEDTRARRGSARPRGRAGSRKKSDGSGATTTLSAVPAGVPDARAGTPEPGAPVDATDRSAAAREGAQEGQGSPAGGAGDAESGRGGAPLTAPTAALADTLSGALGGAAERLLGARWDRKVAHGLSFLRKRVTGDYEVDEFGYDEQLTDQVLMSVLRPFFDQYFRVEVKGIENIPAEGGALVVANHSGTLPLDGLMAQVAVHDHHPAGRHLRLLAADLVFALPVVNELARKAGHTLACTEDAQLLLERGEVVGVMPEGFKGLGKPFADRYKLQRFGRGGFVATALKTGAPIIPCSIVGAEEIYPMVGNSKTLARLLGVPYFPVTPTFPWLGPLGLLPLPTKWTIQFGEPISTDHYPPEAAEDPMLVFNLTDQVRETIQHTLYKLLVQRRSVFF